MESMILNDSIWQNNLEHLEEFPKSFSRKTNQTKEF